jgi:hypothetical protein
MQHVCLRKRPGRDNRSKRQHKSPWNVKEKTSVKKQPRKTRRIHPISISYFPSCCTGPKICATRAVCMMDWSSSGSYSGRITTANSTFLELSILLQEMHNPAMILMWSLSGLT